VDGEGEEERRLGLDRCRLRGGAYFKPAARLAEGQIEGSAHDGDVVGVRFLGE
jgi:hypothetical protein